MIVGHDWLYYDSEEEIKLLLVSLNVKGVREKKLIEVMRKILDKLKLRKRKKGDDGKEDVKEDVKEDGKEEEKKEEKKGDEMEDMVIDTTTKGGRVENGK